MSPDDTAASSIGRRAGRFAVRHWGALILIALTTIFIAQNRERSRMHLLWVTVESPMWLLLSAMFVVGILVGLLLLRRRRK
ncbi:hypothetical protein DSM43518_03912 [Mycobacterium marinum]|uniref:DUF1049 domain-containing protein n=1 Tax=Mycobacterium shottsii TaxID=133549 RepID=A0A7I7L8A8_9MYCO|nr:MULTISPECIES: hypothetical protein [Mycobacterium ulcerans group]AXN47170.1 hypothetical protein MM1218R_05266 [Mycobacterium marinum]AXN52603.1 hypothetical protein CCUG20998_05228 [Mycobacterium marinum]EPQ72009.1 hypothetical protein MMEU_3391 [Mycobacterium marinum str. Europe]MDC8982233.1 DUF1049 domain-containing protein [Mycobacterium marinum]MDC8998955.1 DUF1049 domain-containing protein [Mycobacterium marinum]